MHADSWSAMKTFSQCHVKYIICFILMCFCSATREITTSVEARDTSVSGRSSVVFFVMAHLRTQDNLFVLLKNMQMWSLILITSTLSSLSFSLTRAQKSLTKHCCWGICNNVTMCLGKKIMLLLSLKFFERRYMYSIFLCYFRSLLQMWYSAL